MTVIVRATPLPSLRAEVGAEGSLAAEDAFWRGMSCVFADATFSPAPGAEGADRWLISVGLELRVPANLGCSWLRLEVRVGGDWRPVGVFPEIITRPSGVTGAVRVTPRGAIDRDLIPGGPHLPAYMSGWAASDTTLVWDVLPGTGVVPERLAGLMVLCEGAPPPPIVGHRLQAALLSPVLGRRLALFAGETTNQEVTHMNEDPDPAGGFVEPVMVAEPETDAADLLTRMVRAGRRFGVLVVGANVVGVVDRGRLRSAPQDATAASVAGWPLPVVGAGTPVDQIVAAVREEPAAPADLLGAVVVDDGTPIGFLTAERLEAVGGGPIVRSGEVSGLEGAPVSRLVFECLAHQESLTIAYYDPENRPRCSHDDLMVRRRET